MQVKCHVVVAVLLFLSGSMWLTFRSSQSDTYAAPPHSDTSHGAADELRDSSSTTTRTTTATADVAPAPPPQSPLALLSNSQQQEGVEAPPPPPAPTIEVLPFPNPFPTSFSFLVETLRSTPFDYAAFFLIDKEHHFLGSPCLGVRCEMRSSKILYLTLLESITRLNISALFHFHYNDADLSLSPSMCARNPDLLWNLEKQMPWLYWLSWNPRIWPNGSLMIPHVVVIPDFETFEGLELRPETQQAAPSYEHRHRGLIVWRGSTTGCPFGEAYRESDRYRVALAFHQYKNSPACSGNHGLECALDVSFSGVVQGAVVPEELKSGHLSITAMREFKAVLDIDGNANAWRSFQWKLASGMCVLKVRSTFVQWYYPLLKHGVHLWMLDLSQSPEEMVKEAVRVASNETLCKELGRNGREFALKHFSLGSNTQYIRRTFEEFGKNQSFAETMDWRIS